MGKTLSSQATDWREGRRLRAFELKEAGWSQKQIAQALGVSKGAVSQWMKRGQRWRGHRGSQTLPSTRCEATPYRRAACHSEGASEHLRCRGIWVAGQGVDGSAPEMADQRGVRGELPSRSRQPSGEILGALFAETCSPGEPAQRGGDRALERGALARAEKGALKEGRTILFVDQSGFYMLPAVVRSYAPVGQTPVLDEQLSHDHLSAMSGITLEGKLLMMEQDRAFKGPDVVRFLKHALTEIPGKLLVIWDGSPIHRSRVVKEFLREGAARRVQLEQLPGYAPDLNPDEGIWKHLKYIELKNVCCTSLAELRVELRRAKERLRHKKHVILGCIRQPGFEV
jgi:transposase